MAKVIVIGDGPAGLSAALFLAKNGQQVTLFGGGESWVRLALLKNYLGLDEMEGPAFLERARQQVRGKGAEIVDEAVTAVHKAGDRFEVRTASGVHEADYVVLTSGPKPSLVAGVGLPAGKTVEADRDGRTAVDRFYAAGWAVRADKIQAIISAGDGAAAALDILSREKGHDLHDFDSLD